jgi:hypothetical protein
MSATARIRDAGEDGRSTGIGILFHGAGRPAVVDRLLNAQLRQTGTDSRNRAQSPSALLRSRRWSRALRDSRVARAANALGALG